MVRLHTDCVSCCCCCHVAVRVVNWKKKAFTHTFISKTSSGRSSSTSNMTIEAMEDEYEMNIDWCFYPRLWPASYSDHQSWRFPSNSPEHTVHIQVFRNKYSLRKKWWWKKTWSSLSSGPRDIRTYTSFSLHKQPSNLYFHRCNPSRFCTWTVDRQAIYHSELYDTIDGIQHKSSQKRYFMQWCS